MLRRNVRALAIALILVWPALAAGEPAEDFSDAVASRLLQQVTEGFMTSNQGEVLGAFDAARMKNYARFRENIAALFAQYEGFRAAYRLRQSWPQGDRWP